MPPVISDCFHYLRVILLSMLLLGGGILVASAEVNGTATNDPIPKTTPQSSETWSEVNSSVSRGDQVFHSSSQSESGSIAPAPHPKADKAPWYPDLVCTGFNYPATSLTEGDAFWVTATIRNYGDDWSPSTSVQLFLSTDNDFDTSDDYEVTPSKLVPALDYSPGNFWDVTWNFNFPDLLNTTTYNIWLIAKVDCFNQAVEWDESNNFKSTNSILINNLNQGAPDLSAPNFRLTGFTATEGQSFFTEWDVKNIGNANAGASHARFYLSTDNNLDVSNDFEITPEKSVSSLVPDALQTLRWEYNFPNLAGADWYKAWVVCVVDSRGAVSESNESNVFKANRHIGVTGSGISKPNLTAPGFDLTAFTVTEGDAFFISWKITNEGNLASGWSLARLFLSLDGDQDVSDDHEILPEKAVGMINPGAEIPTRWDFTFPDIANSSTYTVKVVCVVDSRNQVNESDEGNIFVSNQSITVTNKSGSSPDIHITPLNLTTQEIKSISSPVEALDASSPQQPLDLQDPAQDPGEILPDQLIIRFKPETTAKLMVQRLSQPKIQAADWTSDPTATSKVLPKSIQGLRPFVSADDSARKLARKNKTIETSLAQGRELEPAAKAVFEKMLIDSYERTGPVGLFYAQVEPGTDIRATCLLLMEHPDVIYANPVVVNRLKAIPNDPLYPRQWYLNQLNLPTAWDRTTNTVGTVRVCVVDTGVRLNHLDLVGRTVAAKDVYLTNGDAYNNSDQGDDDPEGHGTACAGIIAAIRDNNTLCSGIAPVFIIPVNGAAFVNGDWSVINYEDGVYWGVNNGAHVISLSIGGHRSSPLSSEVDALNHAANNGVVVVAAAGNEGTTADDHYPSAYETVISVAAVDNDNQRVSEPKWWWGSNFGATVDVCAYGQGTVGGTQDSLLTLGRNANDHYVNNFNGTSGATPQVAGLAALLKHANSSLNAAQIRAILEGTATDLVGRPTEDTGGWDPYHGHGLINASAALQRATGGGYASFTLSNQGNAGLRIYSILPESVAPWLKWSPLAPLDLAAGKSRQITVLVDYTKLGTAQATTRLLVASNDANENPYPSGVYIQVNKAPDPTATPTLTLTPSPSATATPTVTVTPTPTQSQGQPADFNQDLLVNAMDLIALLENMGSQNPIYDLTEDNSVNHRDLFEYSRYWQD